MRKQQRLSWLALVVCLLAGSGCCCVQGTGPCGGCGSCSSGSCGLGPLAGFRACSGGCGETYVDEWVSEPPCVDKCCAGNPMPVRSLLRTCGVVDSFKVVTCVRHRLRQLLQRLGELRLRLCFGRRQWLHQLRRQWPGHRWWRLMQQLCRRRNGHRTHDAQRGRSYARTRSHSSIR